MGKIDCGSPRAKFCRERKTPPSRCKRGSFRTVKRGKVTLVVCRPKGEKTTRVQSILRPMHSPRCSVCRMR